MTQIIPILLVLISSVFSGKAQAAEIIRPADALYNMARHHEGKGNRTEALRLYQELLETAPGHTKALHSLILLHLREGKFTKAIPYARQLQSSAPDRAEGFYFEGLALVREGEEQDGNAQKLLEKALVLDPEKSSTHFMLGVIHYRNQREQEARKSFQEAVKREPDFFEPYPFLAALSVKQEDYESAIAYTEKALSLDPESGLQRALSRLYIKAGRYEEGIEGLIKTRQFSDARKAILKHYREKGPELRMWQGILLAREGALQDAVQILEQAVSGEDPLPRAYYELGRLKAALGDRSEARSLIKKSLILPVSSEASASWVNEAKAWLKKLAGN